MFYICLFILQIILYILALKKKQKIIWKHLFIFEGASYIFIILYYFLYNYLDISNNWNILGVLIIGALTIGAYLLWTIISIITRIIVKKKISADKQTSKLSYIYIFIIILFVILSILDMKKLVDERVRRKEFSSYVITYLNTRYGESNYKIKDIYNWNDCGLACIDSGHPNAYEFTIQSDYMNEFFKVQIDIETKQIEEDCFLETYIEDKNWCEDTSLDDCLEKLILSEENSHIPNNNDYKVNLHISFDSTYGNTFYSKIPTIEELTKTATITFENFSIYKNFDNENDFKKFIIDVYKNYLKNYKKYNNTDIIKLKFENGNPFAEYNINYQNEGYIKEQNENIFVYNKPTPIIISQEEIKNT